MSDPVDPLPTEWGPGKTPMGRARRPSSRRREKQQLSCNLCRQRKLRCDRQDPCGTCSKRGLGLSCTYSSPATRPNHGSQRPAITMQERIQQLETLVVDLMQKTAPTRSGENLIAAAEHPVTMENVVAPGSNEDIAGVDSPSSECGSMQFSQSGASYVNSAHWAAVLDGIADIKDHLEDEKEGEVLDGSELPNPDYPEWTGPQLLYGCPRLATKEEILASIPPRPVVDRLIPRYFNSFEMSPAVLHTVQFLKEYEEFWENPSVTPVVWLGLLFTIMCLATQFQKFRLDAGVPTPSSLAVEQDLDKTVDAFRQKIVQCLVLGNYANGGPYVLETLMLYIAAELFIRNDAEIGVWILLGTTIQLAMHMGYHKDPKHFKEISPFTGEMRKRVWATVVELDIGISAQMGHPRLIKQWQADTKEPSNLLDADFDKDTKNMPPPRPETDLTPMLYRLVKARIMTIIGSIWDFAADTRPYTYTEVMKMDKKLEDAHRSIPDCLKWRSMMNCITDSPQIIMQKVLLETIFHRARIVLHRKYLYPSPMKTSYGYSQQTCLDAALKLLDYQHMLQEETQPFCQLYQERWRVSSLVKHDFLLATSILCYYLQQVNAEIQEYSDSSMAEKIRASLKRSHRTWLELSGSSKEAQKAAKALGLILRSKDSCVGDSDMETNTPLSQPPGLLPSSTFTNVGNSHQENLSSLSIQFPVFDAPVVPDWATLTDQALNFYPVPMVDSNEGWQIMDEADMIGSL